MGTARIRTTKPSFWTSQDVVTMSRDARLLMIGLMSLADDDGRFVATRQAVCGYIYPNDDITKTQFEKWFAECCRSMVVTYTDGGPILYGCIPTWHKHQKINRYTPSTIPPPPDNVECAPRQTNKGDME